MSEIDNWVDQAVHRAEELGKQHGSNAAGWWIQEALTKNSSARQTAHATLSMDEEGDPALELPFPDLSGEHADGVLPQDVLDHAFGTGGWDSYSPEYMAQVQSETLDTYEVAFRDTARDECLNACRNELAS